MAHQNNLRLIAGIWKASQNGVRRRPWWPQNPASRDWPFTGARTCPPSHPPARIGGIFLLLRAWVKRTAVSSEIELVPRGGRRMALRTLSTFAHVSCWSREGRIAIKLGSPVSTPTESESLLLFPHSHLALPHQVLICFVFLFSEAKSSSFSVC